MSKQILVAIRSCLKDHAPEESDLYWEVYNPVGWSVGRALRSSIA